MTYVELLLYIQAMEQKILREGVNYLLTDKFSYRRHHLDYKFYPTTEKELEVVDAKLAPNEKTALIAKFTEMAKTKEFEGYAK